MRLFNPRGEGKGGLIFGLFVLFATIFVAWKTVPLMIKVYAYEDKFKEECKYLHRRSLDALKTDLIFDAQQQELPVTEDDITVSKAANTLKADANFVVPIDLAVYVYNWNVSINYEAPIFE
ncbi:MAG: hypothetical protein C5B54_02005 [Acidobacteria bacterium]|nr:MAG: hypothetical protein C5B54_02005 [Acidobacteriota bacterium]